LSRYFTIPVPREVRELLERERGDKDWSDSLLDLRREAEASRPRLAFEKLRQLLTEEGINSIERSSREFREGFQLG